MGNLIKSEGLWLEHFRNKLGVKYEHAKGSVVLSYGKHEVQVSVAGHHIDIHKIFLSIEDKGCPVCHGEVSMAGAVKKDKRDFVLYADIKSNTAVVSWFVEC